jgi:hypothetical protein
MEALEQEQKRAKKGGRRPGSLNKRTITGAKSAEKACRRKGVNPFGVMAEIALNGKDEKARLQAATTLAAYSHGRPKELVSHSGTMTVYDAVAKARARVTAFEQRPKPAAPTEEPETVAPTFPDWIRDNSLETPARQESTPESDVGIGKLRRIVTQ